MRLIKFFTIYCFLIMLSGCVAEEIPANVPTGGEFAYIEGDKVVVNFSIDTPGMGSVSTRALTGEPDYNNMHLFIIEFEDNGNPAVNTLRTIYTPEYETPQSDRVLYKVVLDKTDQPRILHLIALPKDKDLNLEYGVEGSLIPSLKTDDQTPAYWRRLGFRNGYISIGSDGLEKPVADLSQLEHVALIRNHACISITNNTNSNFILTGFSVVNNPTSGTIAPFKMNDYSFPNFLNANQASLTYQQLSENYSGIVPSNLTFSNPDTNPVVENNLDPKYIYERPFNSIRHTYVILKGRRKSDTEDSYYKLDIGKNDNLGVFRYYNLLRNFRYNIILNRVDAQGYKTASEAAKGVVYNNFSFDIELSSMLNISDGNEIVYVNFTTKVLTDTQAQTFEFKYRYRSLSSATATYDNDDVTFIGLEPGGVIKSVEIFNTDDANGWRTVKITSNPAEYETQTQSFTIVKPSGLGRTIDLILHRKWNMQNVKEYSGILENWNNTTSGAGLAGSSMGDNITIFFDIPDNLPEAMFPLTFTFESDHQNIENHPLGKLVVTYGESGFINVPEYLNVIDGRRIMYEKTVSWTEYNDPLIEDDPYDNGTAIDNGDGTYTHRVRNRFRMITNLSNTDVNDKETTVLITNDNFNYSIVKFTRQ